MCLTAYPVFSLQYDEMEAAMVEALCTDSETQHVGYRRLILDLQNQLKVEKY